MAVVCVVALSFLFWKNLVAVVVLATESEIHSHILLVPFISGYLIYIRRKELPQEGCFSFGWAIVPLLGGVIALAGASSRFSQSWGLSGNELSLKIFSFYSFFIATGFIIAGRRWMAANAFPLAFLIFIAPIPDGVIDSLETASKLASADAAHLLFQLSGTPFVREGTIFQLPGIVVEVAQECSGIRSSLVLFITGILAAYMLLKTPWRRFALIAFVIPLGVLRNGVRILMISLLCVHIGPHMIHSYIHRKGGPVFFVASLLPLFVLLYWLRRGEGSGSSKRIGNGSKEESEIL